MKKILHLCLGSFYIDGYSYQENILPKYHKKLGYDVSIIATLSTFDSDGNGSFLKNPGEYVNSDGIPVKRLAYKKRFESINQKLKRCVGVYEAISEEKPDIIFIHGCQFLDIFKVIKYIKKHPDIKVFVDNHADFSNSATNWLSRKLLHGILWKYCAQSIEPYTEKFFGVLPVRCDFLKDVYDIPDEKIDLLVMGADDDKIDFENKALVRKRIRDKYNVGEDDFLIITGGKIDGAKLQTLLLMDAVKELDNPQVKLLIFGSIVPELKPQLMEKVDGNKVQYIGWIKGDDAYNYFLASDIAVFPGRHSVLWEQAVGTGLPCIFKFWEGTTHVDVGGNCLFLYQDSESEIYNMLEQILRNKSFYTSMKEKAERKGIPFFSYQQIAQKSIAYS